MSIPPPLHEARIALLIDADNAPAAKIDVILAELAKIGVANIRRAYGNWKKSELRGWEEVLHDYAIRPIQQFDYSKGKNATDMGMVIDAMDLLYTDRPEAFGIVSSDSDFTPLVLHLKAKGAKVYGFGAKKTPLPFVNACSRFLYLENIGQSGSIEDAPEVMLSSPSSSSSRSGKRGRGGRSGGSGTGAGANGGQNAAVQQAPGAGASQEPRNAEGAPMRMDRSALKRDARLVTLLRNAVESAAGEDGWSALGSVAQQIGNQASFDPRNYGYRKLIDLIDATQLFDLDRRGTQFVLRDKRQGGSPMPAARSDMPRDGSRDAPRDSSREASGDAQRDSQRDAPRDIQRDARDAARDVFLDLQREAAQEDERGFEEEGYDDHDDGRDPRHELSIEANGNTSDDEADDAAHDAGKDADADAPYDARQATSSDSRRDAPRHPPRDAQRNAPREAQRNAPRDAQRDAPRGGRRDAPRDARRDSSRNSPGNSAGNSAANNARDAQRSERGGRNDRNDRNDRGDRPNASRPAAQPNPAIGRPVDRHPFELPADSPARQFANAFRDPPYQAWEPEFDEPVTQTAPATQAASEPVAAPMAPLGREESGNEPASTVDGSSADTGDVIPAAKRRSGRSSKRRTERTGGESSDEQASAADIAPPNVETPAPAAAPVPAPTPTRQRPPVASAPDEPPTPEIPAASSRNRRPKKASATQAPAASQAMADEAAVEPPAPAAAVDAEPAVPARKRPARKSTRPAAKKATARKP